MALGLVVAPLAVPDASAAANPASLDGEAFSGSTVTLSVQGCDGVDGASFEYQSTGTASGPYPGTYSEHGFVTTDENNEVVTDWTAEFTINSAAGTVTGEKHWVAGASTSTDAFCSLEFNNAANAQGLVYTADVPTGSDVGTSAASVDSQPPGSEGSGDLQESFASTTFTPGGGTPKQCRDAENQRHKDAVKSENQTHHNNQTAENARHHDRVEAIKQLPAAQQKSARDAENRMHKQNEQSENQRHRMAMAAEAMKHANNINACKRRGGV